MHVHVGKGPRTPTLLSDLSRGEKALPEQPVCGAVGLTAFCELCHFAKKILNVVFIMTCHSSWECWPCRCSGVPSQHLI